MKHRFVFQIHTNVSTVCPDCRADLNVKPGSPIDTAINHMLDHGYELLHVGAESSRSLDDGKFIHHTIAVVGRA